MNDDNDTPNDSQDINISKEADEQISDELGFEGNMPDEEDVAAQDTLEDAQDLNLHKKADEEHPDQLGVDEDLTRQQEEHIEEE